MKKVLNNIKDVIPYVYITIILITKLIFVNSNVKANTIQNDKYSDIKFENEEFFIIFRSNGTVKSLINKETKQECLIQGINLPAFSITQDMPYDNEIKLTYPAKPKTFCADTLFREGNNLIVGFELTDYEAVINLKITDNYIAFKLLNFRYKMAEIGDKRKTKIDEFNFLQLPIKNREHFGEWLNIMWDEKVAVNLLATDEYCRIDAKERNGYKIFQAGCENEVRMANVGAALIVTNKNNILNRIDRIEHDFNLPKGVESRRSKVYKNSSYTPRGIVTIANIEQHIAYAKKAGLKNILIYYPSFVKTMGHLKWRDEYPNGIEDLKKIAQKIRDAGMLPGLHFHYNKATFTDSYVSPVPDGRLNIRKTFTLRNSIDKNTTTIFVEENPEGCTLDDGRRILKLGNELISYQKYTKEVPYRFLNCKRGAFNTKSKGKEKGTLIGLLDVDTWPVFVRFNQNTNIQDEVAERLAKIIDECGFRSLYFDGSEDVNPPFWYNITKAQITVYNKLKIKPLFSEGALKTHFGWHILTRGNAFDTFYPEDIKKATRQYPIEEIKMISNDFSSIDFGWNNYVAPGIKTQRTDVDYKSLQMEWSTPVISDESTIGIQPDMLEYITSRAAAWNCPITLVATLNALKQHPRTNDNLEVIRRWEIVRQNNYLTAKQKESLKNYSQEHILLINGNERFELLPYKRITTENSKVRAFIFNRNNKVWIVYWHISGQGSLVLPISSDKIKLFKDLGKEIRIKESNGKVILPISDRRYLQFNLEYEKVVELFSKLKLKE